MVRPDQPAATATRRNNNAGGNENSLLENCKHKFKNSTTRRQKRITIRAHESENKIEIVIFHINTDHRYVCVFEYKERNRKQHGWLWVFLSGDLYFSFMLRLELNVYANVRSWCEGSNRTNMFSELLVATSMSQYALFKDGYVPISELWKTMFFLAFGILVFFLFSEKKSRGGLRSPFKA